MKRRTSLWAAASLLVLAACDKTPSSTVDAAPPPSGSATTTTTISSDASAASGTVTVLVTADENGYLLPQDPAKRGGAAQILGVWNTEPKPTLALSAGDHWAGSTISAFYSGEPMAEAMEDGLKITGLPATMAAETMPMALAKGKFQGATTAAMPLA